MSSATGWRVMSMGASAGKLAVNCEPIVYSAVNCGYIMNIFYYMRVRLYVGHRPMSRVQNRERKYMYSFILEIL